jgi:hypothetical protein
MAKKIERYVMPVKFRQTIVNFGSLLSNYLEFLRNTVRTLVGILTVIFIGILQGIKCLWNYARIPLPTAPLTKSQTEE